MQVEVGRGLALVFIILFVGLAAVTLHVAGRAYLGLTKDQADYFMIAFSSGTFLGAVLFYVAIKL